MLLSTLSPYRYSQLRLKVLSQDYLFQLANFLLTSLVILAYCFRSSASSDLWFNSFFSSTHSCSSLLLQLWDSVGLNRESRRRRYYITTDTRKSLLLGVIFIFSNSSITRLGRHDRWHANNAFSFQAVKETEMEITRVRRFVIRLFRPYFCILHLTHQGCTARSY